MASPTTIPPANRKKPRINSSFLRALYIRFKRIVHMIEFQGDKGSDPMSPKPSKKSWGNYDLHNEMVGSGAPGNCSYRFWSLRLLPSWDHGWRANHPVRSLRAG